MLNEGYVLYKSLERCGIRLINRHPDVKEPGKRDGLIVGLNKRGEVMRLEYRRAEEIAKLWTTREGMQNSFPILKLQRPLWKISRNDPIRQSKKDEKEKRRLLSKQRHRMNITGIERKWWERLRERVTALRPFFKSQGDEYTSLYELMSRFLLIKKVDYFTEGVLKMLVKFNQDIDYSLYETILIGNKWDDKKNEYRAEAPLVLDLSDWEKYPVRVASPKMEPFVNECLFKMQGSQIQNNQANAGRSPSALSGNRIQLEDNKFPNPKLPIIGNTYLFSVNKDTPCQTRYGKTSTDIIPVGRKETEMLQDSLNWITEGDRKGKTWYPVPGLVDGNSDLLIVYLENKPDDSANKAHLLGGMTRNYFSESNYAAVSRVAINALKGKQIVKANDLLRLFSLRKADPGRTQVALQRVYTIAELVKSDKDWREAANNVPKVTIPFFRKEIEKVISKEENISTSISEFLNDKESKVTFLSPRCPFPADLVRITQKQWVISGRESTSVSGISLGFVYDIFFAEPNEQNSLVDHLLSVTLQRTQSLLIGMGQAGHMKDMRGYSIDARFTTLKTISAFGLYLYKLGIIKENYMKDTFFYVGRFLSLVDTLHFEWCRNVRGGYPDKSESEWKKAIPPQLLGNAHLNIALDSPVSAFDILSRRINIYQAWTKKEQGDHMKLAWWVVGQLGKISALLAEKTLPSSTTSVERAQILLGYLAKSDEI